MKRYTTPILPIKIRMPFEGVQSIEFLFKKDLEDNSPVLLHKKYATREEIPVEPSAVTTEFTVNLALEAEETAKLMPGEVFMDTLIVLTGGYIPTTKIVKLIIDQSLFAGVKVNGSS
jgi:hypothetical protein